MGLSLTEIKLRKGPICVVRSEPKIGEMVIYIRHHMRLVRKQPLERVYLILQRRNIRLCHRLGMSNQCLFE